MPTYQYACTECEHAFEQVQSFHEDSLTECPQCTGRLRKIFNAVGVVFKGSGFYRTDSRSDSAKGSDSTTSGTSGSSTSTAGGDSGSGTKAASTEGSSTSTTKAAAGAA